MTAAGSAGLPQATFSSRLYFGESSWSFCITSGEGAASPRPRRPKFIFSLPYPPSRPSIPIEAGWDQIEVHVYTLAIPEREPGNLRPTDSVLSGSEAPNRRAWCLEVGDARLLLMVMRPCPCSVSLHTTTEGFEVRTEYEHGGHAAGPVVGSTNLSEEKETTTDGWIG